MGISAALKSAENYFASEYIARVDSGDEIYPERFSEQLKVLERNPNVGLVGVRTKLFVKRNNEQSSMRTTRRVRKNQNLARYLLYSNPFSHGAIMFRKSSFFLAGGYDQTVKIAQDFDLYFRISRHASLFIINKVLHQHTFLDSGTTLSKNRDGVISGIKIRLKYLRYHDIFYPGFWLGLSRDLIFLCLPKSILKSIRTRES
jgi:hypothetical protein